MCALRFLFYTELICISAMILRASCVYALAFVMVTACTHVERQLSQLSRCAGVEVLEK
jgi:hypothetical protein